MRRSTARDAVAAGLPALLLLTMASLAAASPDWPLPRRAPVTDSTLATLEHGGTIFLEVQAQPRDSYLTLAMRYTGSARNRAECKKVNEGRPVTEGLYYAIPFGLLTPRWRAGALLALFPADGPGEGGWVHRVSDLDDGENLRSIATWFTGDENLDDDLAEGNGLAGPTLAPGAEIVVPTELLASGLAEHLDPHSPGIEPVEAVVMEPAVADKPAEPPAGPARKVGDLTFIEDGGRPLAIYRLKRGETLYTAVVARFTGRVKQRQVRAVTRAIVRLSGIKRVKAIPIGYPIKIPREYILPQFLPPDDPRRIAHEARLSPAPTRERRLQGVAIILDAGHGGDDIGARHNGVQEDDYVYDILCRIKTLAENQTAARVLATIKDRSSGYRPLKGPFRIDRDEYLLTSPPYYPRKPHAGTVGVNLRWYLVNSYYRSLVRSGIDPGHIVFVSLHADGRRSSVRGAMVYVPGSAYRKRRYGHRGRLYRRKEVTQARYVRFSRRQRNRSEALSRRLAARLIHALRKAGVRIHADKPVRNHVTRGRRSYVPAVIRTSVVPQSILLEVGNLGNRRDAKLLKNPSFRQKVAVAFLAALEEQYGKGAGRTSIRTARAKR